MYMVALKTLSCPGHSTQFRVTFFSSILTFSHQDLDLLAVGNKLQLEASIDVRTENKKGRGKKITGLHVRTFPGSWSVSVLGFLLLI